jgi:RecA/RadA recombinase
MATARSRTRTAPGAQAPKPKLRGSGVLNELADKINAEFGPDSIVDATDVFKFMKQIPMGHLVGDLCTLGGLQEGQAAMFIGNEGGGKTTQAMRCVAQMQKKYPDKVALWVDSEETFDPLWATQHGVDMSRIKVLRLKSGEDVTDVLKTAKANAEELGMVVLDSVNQTIPMKEYADSAGDAQVALHPRMMGRMVNALTTASKHRRAQGFDPITEIFITQWRTKIGFVMGDPRVIPGGRNFIHYCSAHLEFKAKVKVKRDNDDMETPYIVEHVLNARRVKTPSSLKTGEYHMVVGPDHHLPIGSYDEAGTILSQAKKIGLYTGAGKGQQFEGYDNRFAKMDEAKRWLERNPEEALNIKRALIAHRRQRVGLKALPPDGYLLRW